MISEVSMINHQNVAREKKYQPQRVQEVVEEEDKKTSSKDIFAPVTRDKINPKLR